MLNLFFCSSNHNESEFKLIGIIRTNYDHSNCSKMVISTKDSLEMQVILNEFDMLSPNANRYELPPLKFGNGLWYYFANGNISGFRDIRNKISDSARIGYFKFIKGRNDTIFLYSSSSKRMMAIHENNYEASLHKAYPNEMRKELTKNEWEKIIKKQLEDCWDTIYGKSEL